jgi:outer membrane protein assembly factor BamB
VVKTSIRIVVSLLLVLLGSLGQAQETNEAMRPRWTHDFDGDFWVINTSVPSDYGIQRRRQEAFLDLATIDAIDTQQSTLLVLHGRPDRRATLSAFDSETGAERWKKTGLRLSRWRPFTSYVPARGSIPAYYAQIVGSIVLLSVVKGDRDQIGCSDRPELVALDVRDGRLLWCTSEIPEGDITFVPVPERQTLIAWSAARAGVSLLAFDLRTGATRWRQRLDVEGADWLRLVSYLTALPSPDGMRPPLHHDGRLCVIVGEANRIGPVHKAPKEVTIRMIDIDSGRILWDAPQKLEGLRTWLSWTFSDQSLILSTGRLVAAYDLASGKRLWSSTTPLDDVRSVRIARGERRDVVLVDFDSRNWLGAPTEQGKGLAVLDPSTGDLLWRDPDVRVLQTLSRVGPSVFVRSERESESGVRALNVETGRVTWTVRPPFEDDAGFVRQFPPDRIIVQSSTEVAAYDGTSQAPAFTRTLPRASRGNAQVVLPGIISLVLAPPTLVLKAAIAVEALTPGGTRFKNKEIEPGSEHAFFATGKGGRSRMIAVNLKTGIEQTVSPFIWLDDNRLGNLLDEAHGVVYTLSRGKLAAYPFEIDQGPHQNVHRAADARRALDLYDRADAMSLAKQPDAARREAAQSVTLLQSLAAQSDRPASDLLLVQKALGDSYALLVQLGSDDTSDQRQRAAAAYAEALNLLASIAGSAADPRVDAMRAEIEDRRARIAKR